MIDRSKSKEEVIKENKINEEEELLKKGKAVGGTLAGLGISSLALDKYSNYLSKRPGARPRPEKAAKILKNSGYLLTAAGLPLLGYSHYKHYKLKKDKKSDDNKA